MEPIIENMVIPRVFMSYSWDSDAHKSWVATLATRLRSDGVNVILDQWHMRLGDQLPQFMETAVRDSSFVCIICTPRYRERSNSRLGGVGYEGHVITAEVFHSQNERKFIPVLRLGAWEESAPSWLLGKYFCDLSGEPYPESAYQLLTATIHQQVQEAPPLGSKPPSAENALIAFQRLLNALPVVSENTFEKIMSLELAYMMGGYAENRPTVPEVMIRELQLLQELCDQENVQLPDDWRARFWAIGRVQAVTPTVKKHALQFFRSADVELARVIKLLQRQHSDTRFGLGLLLGFGDITRRSSDADGFETLLRRLVDAGLLREGRPGRPPGSSDYFTTMRHKSTALVGELSRLFELAEAEGIGLDA
jgi:TIR domain